MSRSNITLPTVVVDSFDSKAQLLNSSTLVVLLGAALTDRHAQAVPKVIITGANHRRGSLDGSPEKAVFKGDHS